MSLITVFDAALRRERGWDFPGYPEGVWTAGNVFQSDASGGSAVAQVNVATANVPEGIAYSIEAFEFQTSADTTDLMLQATNFDITTGLTVSRGYQMINFLQAGQALNLINGQRFDRPWFLGQVVDRTIASAISIVHENITGKVSIFHLSGYYWTPRSILQVDGGYRRPADGLFSR